MHVIGLNSGNRSRLKLSNSWESNKGNMRGIEGSPEGENFHISQFPDDGDIRQFGPPAVQLLHMVHVAHSSPAHLLHLSFLYMRTHLATIMSSVSLTILSPPTSSETGVSPPWPPPPLQGMQWLLSCIDHCRPRPPRSPSHCRPLVTSRSTRALHLAAWQLGITHTARPLVSTIIIQTYMGLKYTPRLNNFAKLYEVTLAWQSLRSTIVLEGYFHFAPQFDRNFFDSFMTKKLKIAKPVKSRTGL